MVALLVAVVRGGSGFFYCTPMQSVMSMPCCGGAELEPHEDDASVGSTESSLVAPPCCQAKRVAVMSPAPLPNAPPEAAAPLSTVVPCTDGVVRRRPPPAPSVRSTHAVCARAPTALERRAELMVFHL